MKKKVNQKIRGKNKNNKIDSFKWWFCGCALEAFKVGVMALIIVLVFFIGAKAISEIKTISRTPVDAPSIVVSGEGRVFVKPDIGQVTLSVTEEAETVGKAQKNAASAVNRLTVVLAELGIVEKDIKTTSFTINPVYQFPDGKREFVAYRVQQKLEVKIRDLDKSGSILERASDVGVKEISGLTFKVDDPTAAKEEARAKAIADAKEKARKLAGELGVKLGKIISFNESGYVPPAPRFAILEAVGIGGGITPDVPVGENEIRSNITITFELK